MLKVGGMWVSPIEVENALVAHDAVQECGVVGREDARRLVKPVAFVVLRRHRRHAGARRGAAGVRAGAAGRLQTSAVGRFVDELPNTATGKIQRFKLRGDGIGPTGAAAER